MVQKSGYFSRSAASNETDVKLIKSMTDLAVDTALKGESGVIGHDEENGDVLTAIAFPRIAGGKAFDINQGWFGSDRKSTRLNSSHVAISYAVFCLKKKKQ